MQDNYQDKVRKERLEAFDCVEVVVRARINELCNENKHEEAEELLAHLEAILPLAYK